MNFDLGVNIDLGFLAPYAPLAVLLGTTALLAISFSAARGSRTALALNVALLALLTAFYARELAGMASAAGQGWAPVWLREGLSARLAEWRGLLLWLIPGFGGVRLQGVTLLALSPNPRYVAGVAPAAALAAGMAARWLLGRWKKRPAAQAAAKRYWLPATVLLVLAAVLHDAARLDWVSAALGLAMVALLAWAGAGRAALGAWRAVLAVGRLLYVGAKITVMYAALLAARALRGVRRVGRSAHGVYGRAVVKPAVGAYSASMTRLQNAERRIAKALADEKLAGRASK